MQVCESMCADVCAFAIVISRLPRMLHSMMLNGRTNYQIMLKEAMYACIMPQNSPTLYGQYNMLLHCGTDACNTIINVIA